jgi:hypothetical protein
MGVLWIGNEADCYLLSGGNAIEESGAQDTGGYARTGMRVSRTDASNLTSTPDWGAVDEIWHKFNYVNAGGVTAGFPIWAAKNAAGQIVAQILSVSAGSSQFQIWSGSAFVNVGAAITNGSTALWRYDVHFKGGAAGYVEIWAGPAGAQTKILDTSGAPAAWGSAVAIVRVYHEGTRTGGGFNTNVGSEIVQTTSTLSTRNETKQPTSNGTDVGGTGTWADVDESNPFNDSDVVTLSASGQHQSFKAAARTLTQAVVSAVTASCRAWYEVGGPTQIKPYLTISGTRYYGTTFALGLTPQGYQYSWTINPATSAAFTQAEANAATLEWGWEAV